MPSTCELERELVQVSKVPTGPSRGLEQLPGATRHMLSMSPAIQAHEQGVQFCQQGRVHWRGGRGGCRSHPHLLSQGSRWCCEHLKQCSEKSCKQS